MWSSNRCLRQPGAHGKCEFRRAVYTDLDGLMLADVDLFGGCPHAEDVTSAVLVGCGNTTFDVTEAVQEIGRVLRDEDDAFRRDKLADCDKQRRRSGGEGAGPSDSGDRDGVDDEDAEEDHEEDDTTSSSNVSVLEFLVDRKPQLARCLEAGGNQELHQLELRVEAICRSSQNNTQNSTELPLPKPTARTFNQTQPPPAPRDAPASSSLTPSRTATATPAFRQSSAATTVPAKPAAKKQTDVAASRNATANNAVALPDNNTQEDVGSTDDAQATTLPDTTSANASGSSSLDLSSSPLAEGGDAASGTELAAAVDALDLAPSGFPNKQVNLILVFVGFLLASIFAIASALAPTAGGRIAFAVLAVLFVLFVFTLGLMFQTVSGRGF